MKPVEKYEEFEYFAEDCVTVRAPNKEFYLCRILEDVTESTEQINIAWFDKISRNRYKVRIRLFVFISILFFVFICFHPM